VNAFAHGGERAALAALFCLFAAFSPAGRAQLDGSVARPDIRVDDRWIYRRSDYRFEPPVLLYELRVSFVDQRAIHTVLARQGRPRDSDATWTPEWNSVVSVDDGIVDTRGGGLLQFPLSAGRAYSASWEMRRPRAGRFHVRHDRTVKVVGWEEVEVPAGRFQALKVEAEGRWGRLDNTAAGWARNTVWYVPAVKRWVKSLYEDANGKVGEELVFFVVE
jgi:hypothetical protein